MSIIKDSYRSIPESIFKSTNIDDLFDHYKKQFLTKEDGENGFITLSLNLINDFLKGKIDENTLSKIINRSLFDEDTKDFHDNAHLSSMGDIISFLHRLLDITWAKEGENYNEFKNSIQKEFNSLVKKYSK